MMMMTGLAFFLSAASLPGEVAPATTPQVRLAMGTQVKDHQIVDEQTGRGFRPGETVVAWTEITGLATGFVEHVWMRDGQEIARHYLPVSNGRRWRTWSRHKSAAGKYLVLVLGPDGKEHARASFEVKQGD
jgi:hypothetical protein